MSLPIGPRATPHEWFEQKSLELFRCFKRPVAKHFEVAEEIWVDTHEPNLTQSSSRKSAAVQEPLYLPVVRSQAASQPQRI